MGSIARVYEQYPHLRETLPSMGYGAEQVHELEETIRGSEAEIVVDGSPVDLKRILRVPQPIVSVRYDYEDVGNAMTARLEAFVRTLPG